MRKQNYTLTLEHCDGTKRNYKIASGAGFAAARGIAAGTHYGVELAGKYGTATFKADGCGEVRWNANSTRPNETTPFAENCTVSL